MRKDIRRSQTWLIGAALALPLAFGSAAEAHRGPIPAQQAAGAERPVMCQYRPLRHETIDGLAVSIVERVAPLPDAAAQRVVVWIDDAEHRVWKIEVRDRTGRPAYTVRYLRYARDGGKWVPTAVYVLDESRHESTVVREIHEVGGIDLDAVRTAAVGCASLS